jgi:probable rRNA maturation factor
VEDIAGKREGEVSVVFADSEYMASLNEKYRGKKGATNVLAFPLGNKSSHEDFLGGDIIVCEEKACSPEKQIRERCDEEIVYLVIHALLHIYGYDHQTEDDFETMHALESQVWEAL